MFLHLKPKWRPFDEVWFTNTLMGQNQLPIIINKQTIVFLDLKYKVLSNLTFHLYLFVSLVVIL